MSVVRGWWRPRNLLLAWSAYWAALIVVGLGPAILAAWRMSHRVDSHGRADLSFGNGAFSASIAEAGKATWAGSISLLTLALLVAVPPLVLWMVWLVGVSRTNNAGAAAELNRAGRKELYAKDSRTEILESSLSARRAREES